MGKKYDPEILKEKSTVIIPWRRLNPELQQIIGRPLKKIASLEELDSIRTHRRLRTLVFGMGLTALLQVLGKVHLSAMKHPETGAMLNLTFVKMYGHYIRAKNAELLKAMNKYGIIQTKYEELYPKKWLNPAMVASTHPIFYIDQRGNLVLRKATRMEYYRYLWQQKLPGQMGFHPWRWRVYIRPPVVPEPWREWAKARLRKEMARLKPLPKPVPQPTPNTLRTRKQKRKRSRVRA